MNTNNRTGFSMLAFPSRDLFGDEFQVVVIKATFDISPKHGLRRCGVQDPVRVAALPFAGAAATSVCYAEDIAPYKPRADVLLTATAYAPEGRPAKEWLAGARVGEVEKQVLVTGPRVWTHTPVVGWRLGAPLPAHRVPLRYERAFGGVAHRGAGDEGFAENPIGLGFVDLCGVDKSKPIAAPQILTPGSSLSPLGNTTKVEGMGPVHASWQPRLGLAGSFDEAWRSSRWPALPEDFDFGFYNCAHPDLRYPGFLSGHEEVCLYRLCERHEEVRFDLPGLVVGVALTDTTGFRYGGAARLDTLHIDTERMKVWLVWRATLPLLGDALVRLDIVADDSFVSSQARAKEA